MDSLGYYWWSLQQPVVWWRPDPAVLEKTGDDVLAWLLRKPEIDPNELIINDGIFNDQVLGYWGHHDYDRWGEYWDRWAEKRLAFEPSKGGGVMFITKLVNVAHATAKSKGFWDASDNIPEKLALIHSEVSEVLEAYRNNEGQERIGEELADIMIRVADLAGHLDINLEDAIIVKMAINKDRPHMHGKRC